MMQLLRDLLRFNLDLKRIEEISPPTVKIHVSKTMLPWMEVVIGCVAQGSTVEQVKYALWQCGLYMDPASPDGMPPKVSE